MSTVDGRAQHSRSLTPRGLAQPGPLPGLTLSDGARGCHAGALGRPPAGPSGGPRPQTWHLAQPFVSVGEKHTQPPGSLLLGEARVGPGLCGGCVSPGPSVGTHRGSCPTAPTGCSFRNPSSNPLKDPAPPQRSPLGTPELSLLALSPFPPTPGPNSSSNYFPLAFSSCCLSPTFWYIFFFLIFNGGVGGMKGNGRWSLDPGGEAKKEWNRSH